MHSWLLETANLAKAAAELPAFFAVEWHFFLIEVQNVVIRSIDRLDTAPAMLSG
jgi:hypothetical protein